MSISSERTKAKSNAHHPHSDLFESAIEFAVSTPNEVPWIAHGILAEAAITQIAGKIKQAGKTTFTMEMVAAIIDGKPFLERPTSQTRVVYLTEQPSSSLRQALEFSGLLWREELTLLRWHKAYGLPWPDIVAAARWKAQEQEAKVLIVDTLHQWAGFTGDQEGSTGAQMQAMQPLQMAAGEGLGIHIIAHERKSGGSVADAVRGGSAGPGVVDSIFVLRGVEGKATNVRRLESLSRFEDAPSFLEIALTEDGYIILDNGEEVRVRRVEDELGKLWDIMHENPKLTTNAIVERSGMRKQRVVDQLNKYQGAHWQYEGGGLSRGLSKRWVAIGSRPG